MSFKFSLLWSGIFCVILLTKNQEAKSNIPYDSAVHYWPLDKETGLRDVVTNTTGIRDGRVKKLYFEGNGPEYLFISKSRVNLGNFEGSCLVDPTKCSPYLSVSLWLRYSRRRDIFKNQFFIGTRRNIKRGGRPGFSILANPQKGDEDRVTIYVNTDKKLWTGHINIPHGIWAQVGFTWSNSSGLDIFRNCERVRSVVSGTKQISSKESSTNVYLVKAPGRGKAAFNISYDDIAVWYSPLNQKQKGRICSNKLEPPVLVPSCDSGPTWLTVRWKPSDPDYDTITGFYVWYRLNTKWKKIQTNSSMRMLKIKGLVSGNNDCRKNKEMRLIHRLGTLNPNDPSSSVEIRVQSKIHKGHGRTSKMIICRTSDAYELGNPYNLTVEATSSRTLLIKWKRPLNKTGVRGYWVLYKEANSSSDFTKLDVGLLYKCRYLLPGLSRDTRYRIKVISYGKDPSFKPSLPAQLIASTDKDDSRTVLRVNIRPVREKTMLIYWTPPFDPITPFWYKAFMKWKYGDLEKMIEVYRGNKTNYTFTMNNIPYRYAFYVMSYIKGFVQPVPLTVPPRNLTVQSISWGSAVVAWQPPIAKSPRDFVNQYRVTVESTGRKVELKTLSTSVTVAGLKQLTSYRVNVQAGNQVGYGPFLADDVLFKTLDMDECAKLTTSCRNTSKDILVFDYKRCDDDIVRCHSNGRCVNTEGSFYCKCNSNYIGDGWNCQEIPGHVTELDFCQKVTSQKIKWTRSLRGQTDLTSCPEGVTGVARRFCGGPEGQRASWETPDLSDCVSKWALEMKELANNPKVSASSVAEQTANLTNVRRIDKIYPGDLKAIVNVLETVSGREEKKAVNSSETKEFTKLVVHTASNILDSKTINKWAFIPKVSRKNQTGVLIDTVDSVALRMAQTGQHGRTTMKNVVLDVGSTNQSASSSLVIGGKKNNYEENETMVMFPSSELNQDSSSQFFTYASFNTIGSLLVPETKRINGSVNTAVVSLTMSNLKRKSFIDPVAIVFTHTNRASEETSNSSCVYWDTSKTPAYWSTNGCYVNATNSTHTVCHCYHLTSFAVLMSVKGDTSALVQGRHKIALTLITYIGVVLSVAALCLTFVTFLSFRFLKSSRTFIHSNLALSLILAQLLFLFGVNKTQIKLVCQIIAGALHYIWLASFVWMALEGVMLYLMLVKVFGTKTLTRKKRVLFLTIGWCLPLIAVAVSAGLYPHGYGTKYYCWLSMNQGFIWAFVGPALLIIVFNFVIMGVTFSVMARRIGHRRKPSKIRRIRYWAKACTLLTCILGLTWLFGVFYINNETVFMAYFFTIFNSLQGVFIFLFHCVGDEKIRREYIRILCCREKGPAYTLASKSHKSDSGREKMIKTLDNGESKTLNYNTVSTGTTSSDSQRPVLVMFQKRSSFGQRSSLNRGDSESVSSQRISGEVISNPRDSLASFSSFKLQNRNSGRYSLASREADANEHQPVGELSIVEEVSSTVHDTAALEDAPKV